MPVVAVKPTRSTSPIQPDAPIFRRLTPQSSAILFPHIRSPIASGSGDPERPGIFFPDSPRRSPFWDPLSLRMFLMALSPAHVPMIAPTDLTQATEEQLIDRAQQSVFDSNWVVGECASLWTTRYARGRTDADFAQHVGLSADQVYQRRRVWETFAGERDRFAGLRWSHFYAALTWDDALESLDWAQQTLSTVAEMRAWRRARRGEDLTTVALEESVRFLADIPETVGTPTEGGELSESGSRSGEARTSAPGMAAVARESAAEEEYTPFKSGASASPAEAAAPPSCEQLTRRMTSACEKFLKALGPKFRDEFPNLPDKVRARFLRAVADLGEAVEGL